MGGGEYSLLFKLGWIISQRFGRHNGSKIHATRHIITFCHPGEYRTDYTPFQLYSFVQLFPIIVQEGIILQHQNQTSTTPVYGSVLQPPGMEREELRVYHSLLVVVFTMVLLTCFLLVIGILRNIHLLLLPWLASTFLSILTEAAILFFLTTHKKVRIWRNNSVE